MEECDQGASTSVNEKYEKYNGIGKAQTWEQRDPVGHIMLGKVCSMYNIFVDLSLQGIFTAMLI